MDHNSIFEKMVDEATENVARKGWKNATQKEVTLAAFGMLSRQIKGRIQSITKPFWWLAGAVGAGVVWYIISGIFSLPE